MAEMEVQLWSKEKERVVWKPMGRAATREQALGQAWLIRQLMRNKTKKAVRIRIRRVIRRKARSSRGRKR